MSTRFRRNLVEDAILIVVSTRFLCRPFSDLYNSLHSQQILTLTLQDNNDIILTSSLMSLIDASSYLKEKFKSSGLRSLLLQIETSPNRAFRF